MPFLHGNKLGNCLFDNITLTQPVMLIGAGKPVFVQWKTWVVFDAINHIELHFTRDEEVDLEILISITMLD